MGRAATITVAASALVIAGLVALAIPAFTGMDADQPEAPAVGAVGPAADAPSVQTTAPATPDIPELPDWAEGSGPWIIYPDGFECQGTEGCPNDYRSLIGEPGDVLPRNVYYYDAATHDFDPANPNRFFVSPKAAPGADLGPMPGADGYAVVSGVDRQVKSYYVGRADTLDAIGERFSIDPAELTRDGDRLVFP